MIRILSQYFRGAMIVSVVGFFIGGIVGYEYTGTLSGALEDAFLTFVLGLLEISLSFDNAVVNATALKRMNAKWRRRFMTWGMIIAVFGMRILFPLMVVSAIAWIDPWQALKIALWNPVEYARIMRSSHTALGGFGASFLLLVSLRYFFDAGKDVHWFAWIERPLSSAGRLFAADVFFCIAVFAITSRFLHHDVKPFLISAAVGIGSFILLHLAIRVLHVRGGKSLERASVSMFLYLEVLDASFSLDGVIGGFAITNNLLVIAIGLGIGAMFVRSLTLMLVDKRTLNEFRYLEHGAFYAIAALAVLMLVDLFTPVPEALTGLIGVAVIGLSLLSSIRHKEA